MTREDIAAAVARELSAQRAQAPRNEKCAQPPADDAERRRLEKKLSDAEAQIERLSNVLKSIDDKLPAKPPPSDN